VPTTSGTLPGDTPTFGALVFATILLVGALCFFRLSAGIRENIQISMIQ
jgi:K+-transporting ATPase A subunit